MPRKSPMSKAGKKSTKTGIVRYSYNSNPVPDEERVTIRYTDTLDATATVGFYSYLFALNDIYDPDVTSTGSQPPYYDEWSALYNRWVVPECEYDVAVTSRTVSGRLSVAVAPVTAASLVPANFEAASSIRYAKAAETTGGGPTYHIKGKVNIAKLYGVPDYVPESDDQYAGSINNSPTRRCVLAIVAQTSGSSDALSLTVVLKFKVRFFQPYPAALSLSSRSPADMSADLPVGCTVTRPGLARCRRSRPPEAPSVEEKPVAHKEDLCTCGCMRHF